MKSGLSTDHNWEYIGALLANSGDDEQLKFFQSFVKECLGWGTKYQVEQQLACVNSKLSHEERDVLGMLGYNENND